MTPCPLSCGTPEPPVETQAAGIPALVPPASLGLAIPGDAFLDPRASQSLTRAIRATVLRVRDAGGNDPLTRVLSRDAFLRALGRLIEEARHRHFIAVALVRWTDAEAVYSSLGSLAGDEILKAIAARVRFGVREGDEVGRVGAFAFALALRGADEEAAISLAQRVAEGAGQEYHPGYTPALAYAVAPADGLDPEAAIENANGRWIPCPA